MSVIKFCRMKTFFLIMSYMLPLIIFIVAGFLDVMWFYVPYDIGEVIIQPPISHIIYAVLIVGSLVLINVTTIICYAKCNDSVVVNIWLSLIFLYWVLWFLWESFFGFNYGSKIEILLDYLLALD